MLQTSSNNEGISGSDSQSAHTSGASHVLKPLESDSCESLVKPQVKELSQSCEQTRLEMRELKLKVVADHLQLLSSLPQVIQCDPRISEGIAQAVKLKDEITRGDFNDVLTVPSADSPIVTRILSDEKILRQSIVCAIYKLRERESVSRELFTTSPNSILDSTDNAMGVSYESERIKDSEIWSALKGIFSDLYVNGFVCSGLLKDFEFLAASQFGPERSPRFPLAAAGIFSASVFTSGFLQLVVKSVFEGVPAMVGSLAVTIGVLVGTAWSVFKSYSYLQGRDTTPISVRNVYGKVCSLNYSLDNGVVPPIDSVLLELEEKTDRKSAGAALQIFAMKVLGERPEYIVSAVADSRESKHGSYRSLDDRWKELAKDENCTSEHVIELVRGLFSVRAIKGLRENLLVTREIRGSIDSYVSNLPENEG